jgi:hypothetical protein
MATRLVYPSSYFPTLGKIDSRRALIYRSTQLSIPEDMNLNGVTSQKAVIFQEHCSSFQTVSVGICNFSFILAFIFAKTCLCLAKQTNKQQAYCIPFRTYRPNFLFVSYTLYRYILQINTLSNLDVIGHNVWGSLYCRNVRF